MQKRVCLLLMVILTSYCLLNESSVYAKKGVDKPSVLVVYSSSSEDIDEHQRMLDMLLGHFTDEIIFKHSHSLQEADLVGVTHVFYFGQVRERLPEYTTRVLQKFNGVFTVIGHNAAQFKRMSFVKQAGKGVYSKVTWSDGDEDKTLRVRRQSLLQVEEPEETSVLVKASHGEEHQYPLLIKKEQNYYLAVPSLEEPVSLILADTLHDIFQTNGPYETTGYLRLEDVHPLADPKKLREIADILMERNIPYMIAVIPVYTNEDTKEQHFLSDYPEVLEALSYMQDNGGSIVMHGYTHQFRDDETGEGFEFWDVENNMPIYHGPTDEVVKKTKADFPDAKAYNDYREDQKAFEKDYIDEKLTRGIQELANYGLYPLAFEAPHYTMSQNGYAVTSDYFSTYVGQVQLSDEDWETMSGVPYVTKPTFFKGMELLPETIGYVDPDDPNAIEKMIKRAKEHLLVRDGMVAGFYHPFLGTEKLMELLDELEKLPPIEWIDLKERENVIQAENVEIASEKGEVLAAIDKRGLVSTSWDFPLYHVKTFVTKSIWGIVGAGSLAICLFLFYALRTTLRYRRGRIG
ncbi:DUF2334 domain-containing protein [Oceanobacillus manasiensis]|uniref:DUF2334 domain-containing protein n=1 Tax=Oceanobacillus manasiensis TaxID=586413 RepID=UPI000693C824|nr:polysaccharide deacetylase family protein [Oceanobacillus manasiensis]